jgi:hypothetical protein
MSKKTKQKTIEKNHNQSSMVLRVQGFDLVLRVQGIITKA